MKKIIVDKVVGASRIIGKASLKKMDRKERHQVIKATHRMKKTATDFEDFLKDASEKLRPEGFDAIAEKLARKEELTAEEQKIADDYNREVSECVEDELRKEVELDIEPLSEDAMESLFDSNDFIVDHMILLSEVLGDGE